MVSANPGEEEGEVELEEGDAKRQEHDENDREEDENQSNYSAKADYAENPKKDKSSRKGDSPGKAMFNNHKNGDIERPAGSSQ